MENTRQPWHKRKNTAYECFLNSFLKKGKCLVILQTFRVGLVMLNTKSDDDSKKGTIPSKSLQISPAITNMLIPYISLCCNYLPLYTMHVTFYYFSADVFLNGQIFNLPPSSLSLHSCSYTTPSARYLLIVYPPSPPCLSATPLICRLFCAVLAHTHRPLAAAYWSVLYDLPSPSHVHCASPHSSTILTRHLPIACQFTVHCPHTAMWLGQP
jgi:hypothetical protein